MKTTRLIDCFPEWLDGTSTGGIFKDISSGRTTTFPWLSNYALLDAEYFGNRSGNKSVTPLIKKFIHQNEDDESPNPVVLTASQRTLLANIIVFRFQEKWTKLYALLSKEYDPIENYSMTETETPNLTQRHGVSTDYQTSDTRSTNTDVDVTTNAHATSSLNGFNSSTPVPVGDTSSNGGTTTSASAESNTETNIHTQSGYTEDTETGSRTLTRSGNIGVTTSQQMIESEIALWQWNFIESVYKDVDTVLTLSKYQI